jgi:hypothetical protein
MTYTLRIEKVSDKNLTAVLMEKDANGVTSVVDMIVTTRENMTDMAMIRFAAYEWLFDGRQMANVDTGRVYSKKSLLRKLVEQI